MFEEKPATNQSIAQRKSVEREGVNDADYMTNQIVNGKRECCPYYKVWHSMLFRCYSLSCHNNQHYYSDCSVSKDWLHFMKFRGWMEQQDWLGKDLDKDIITPGNKVYSSEKCVFVSATINSMLSREKETRGFYFDKSTKKYRVDMNNNSESVYLGRYDTPEEASTVYLKAKTAHIIEIAQKQTDPRIKNGLMLHAELMLKKLVA